MSMANTMSSPTRHIDALIRYVLTEKPGEAKGSRYVAASGGGGFVPDAPLAIRYAEAVMREHGKLAGFVQGYHVIDSYAVDELDPTSAVDIERAQRVGRRRARAIAHGRPFLVVTQIDGKGSAEHPGGKIHNHIVILSVHPVTGRSFDSSWVTHKPLATAHDELLAEMGVKQTNEPVDGVVRSPEVFKPTELRAEAERMLWSFRRDMTAFDGEPFDEPEPPEHWLTTLKRKVRQAMADPRCVSRDALVAVARHDYGLDVRLTGKDGISYSLLDQQGGTTRQTRKASTLGTDFMTEAVDAANGRNATLQMAPVAATKDLVKLDIVAKAAHKHDVSVNDLVGSGHLTPAADHERVARTWQEPATPAADHQVNAPGQKVAGSDHERARFRTTGWAGEGPESTVDLADKELPDGAPIASDLVESPEVPAPVLDLHGRSREQAEAVVLRYLGATQGDSLPEEQRLVLIARLGALQNQLGMYDLEPGSEAEAVEDFEDLLAGRPHRLRPVALDDFDDVDDFDLVMTDPEPAVPAAAPGARPTLPTVRKRDDELLLGSGEQPLFASGREPVPASAGPKDMSAAAPVVQPRTAAGMYEAIFGTKPPAEVPSAARDAEAGEVPLRVGLTAPTTPLRTAPAAQDAEGQSAAEGTQEVGYRSALRDWVPADGRRETEAGRVKRMRLVGVDEAWVPVLRGDAQPAGTSASGRALLVGDLTGIREVRSDWAALLEDQVRERLETRAATLTIAAARREEGNEAWNEYRWAHDHMPQDTLPEREQRKQVMAQRKASAESLRAEVEARRLLVREGLVDQPDQQELADAVRRVTVGGRGDGATRPASPRPNLSTDRQVGD